MEFFNETASVNCTDSRSQSVTSALDTLDSILLPCIAVFGIMGNLFSIAVFQHGSKLKRLASSVYLIALALSDSIFLFTLLLFIPHLRALENRITCKLVFYFMNVSGVISSWLVVLFTVERFFVIAYPLTTMAKCSRRRARYLVLLLCPIPCLMFVYTAVVLIDVVEENDGRSISWKCLPQIKQFAFEATVLHSIEISLTYFVPAFIIVALNLRIGLKLIRRSVERCGMRSGSMLVASSEVVVDQQETTPIAGKKSKSKADRLASFKSQRSVSTTSDHRRSRIGSTAASSPASSASANDNAITRTLIFISTSFALLNLPHNVVLLYELCAQLMSIGECFAQSDFMYVLKSICYALYYANFGVNFVVYHVTSSNYREGAKELTARLTSCFENCRRRILFRPISLDERTKMRRASSQAARHQFDQQIKLQQQQQRNAAEKRSRSPTTPSVSRKQIDEDATLLPTITEAEVVDNFFPQKIIKQ